MALILLIFSIAFLLLQVFIPAVRANKQFAARRFIYEYRHMQLQAVKRYYAELEGLSHREISRRYNVSRAYHLMGREHLRLDE